MDGNARKTHLNTQHPEIQHRENPRNGKANGETQAFFCNSGTEANEAAIKSLAVRWVEAVEGVEEFYLPKKLGDFSGFQVDVHLEIAGVANMH